MIKWKTAAQLIYIYIYIIIQRLTVSLYPNFSVAGIETRPTSR